MTDRIVKVVLRGEVAGFTGSMAKAGKSVTDAAGKMTAADKESQKFRRGLSGLGDSARNVGLVAAAGLGAIVVATARFDSAMSKVQAATHESEKGMEDLREAAIRAGADTAFSASESAGAIEELAKAGVSSADVLGGGLAGALDLAAAGGLAVADAAEIAATALVQFKLDGEEVPHVADLLAAAAGKAQGDVSDMGMALKQAGLVASQMGLSIEETSGTLAAFAANGLLGSDAGTSFRTMLLRLANPTDESADLMKKLGIAAYDAQGQFVGMESIAGQLTKAFEGKTQAERDSAMATLFGSDAIRAASVLYSQGADGVADWTKKVDDSGYAAETAALRMDNLAGDVEKLKGSLETALIGAGEGSTGALRGLVQGLEGAANAFNKLPAAAQGTVTGLLGITAVTGGSLWFGAKVIGGISDTRAALNDLGPAGAKAKTALSGVGKGFTVVAILQGLGLVDDALDDLFDRDLDDSTLKRSLISLTKSTDGGSFDLEKFKNNLIDTTGAMENLGDVGTTVGRVLDKIPFDGGFLSGGVETARENLEKLDKELADMADSGDQDQAAAIFDELAAAAEEAGVSTKDLTKIFEQYGVALDNLRPRSSFLGDVEDAAAKAARAAGLLPDKVDPAAKSMGRMAEKSKEARDAARETADEFLAFGDSLDDAKVSMQGWIKEMADQADALNNFTDNARKAANRGLRGGLIAALAEAGPEGARRMRQLANATKDELAKANRAWDEQQQAMQRWEKFRLTPKKPKVEIDTSAIAGAIAGINLALNNIPDEFVNVIVKASGAGAAAGAIGAISHASGGYISGPGGPRDDLIPALLSDGEYVIQASAVSKYGTAAMDSINQGSAGLLTKEAVSLPMAAGGTTHSNFAPGRLPLHAEMVGALR